MINLTMDHIPETGEEFLVFIDDNDAQVFNFIVHNDDYYLMGRPEDLQIAIRCEVIQSSDDNKIHMFIDNNDIVGQDADSLNDGTIHHIKIMQKTINKLDYNKLKNIPCYSKTIVGTTLFDGEFEAEEQTPPVVSL